MIKAEMADVRAANYAIKHAKLIPLDRRAGADAYAVAVQRLNDGELIGLHPEATISRSFELNDFKNGAARMVLEAHVPIIPLIVWGAHRIWSKDHPKHLFCSKVPITVMVGPALLPAGDVEQLNTRLRETMTSMLHGVQEDYPHPEGAYWVPRRLGGSAPIPEESVHLGAIEQAERAERARKQGVNRR